MSRKSILLAVAASAVLGLAMLAPTTADAAPGHRHGFHGHGHGHGHAHGHGHGHGHWHRRPHRPHWHTHWHRRPIWYAPRPVIYGSYSVPRVAGPCTCLSKEYTPEGAVLFKDRCTNEMAMNPPAQAPQQSGALDTQGQANYAQQYVQPAPNGQPVAR